MKIFGANCTQNILDLLTANSSTAFAYLTDVYVDPAYQGLGLGTWLIACCNEWMRSLPCLRWCLLVAGEESKERYYEKVLGMKRLDGTVVIMEWRGPGDRIHQNHA